MFSTAFVVKKHFFKMHLWIIQFGVIGLVSCWNNVSFHGQRIFYHKYLDITSLVWVIIRNFGQLVLETQFKKNRTQ